MKVWLLLYIALNVAPYAMADERHPDFTGPFAPQNCAAIMSAKLMHLPQKYPGVQIPDLITLQARFELTLDLYKKLRQHEQKIFDLSTEFQNERPEFDDEVENALLYSRPPSRELSAAFTEYFKRPDPKDPKKLARLSYYFGEGDVTLSRFQLVDSALQANLLLFEYEIYYLAVLREYSRPKSLNYHAALRDKQIAASNAALNELGEKSRGRKPPERALDLAEMHRRIPVFPDEEPMRQSAQIGIVSACHVQPEFDQTLAGAIEAIASYDPVPGRRLRLFVPASLYTLTEGAIVERDTYPPLPLAVTHLLKFHLEFLSMTSAPPSQGLRAVFARAFDLLVTPN